MKTWLLYINAFLLLAVVGFLFGFSQQQNKQQKLTDVEVIFKNNKAVFLTESMVNKLLIHSEENLLNKAKSKINLYELEQKVRKNKMIENAEVFIAPNGQLQAYITQRVPIARIMSTTDSYYIDRIGLTMPLSPNHSARVPLVTGIHGKEMKDECFKLIQKLRTDDFFKKQIIGIHRKSNGEYQLNTRIGKHKILIGKPVRIENKMRKLKVFYKKEWESETLKNCQLINLKYNYQVICS